MKKIILLMVVLVMIILSGCSTKQSETSATSAEKETTTASSSTPSATTTSGSNEQFSQDIVNCVKGTPWTYSGITAGGAYTVSYTIEGKTMYKGKEYCKVVGKVEGSGIPNMADYNWEYYFRWDNGKGTYSDICYKFSYPGVPAQEACVLTDASGSTIVK